MNIENENNLKAALRQDVNLFLGAGFSVLANDAEGRPLPTGGELTTELATTFSIRRSPHHTLPQICTMIEHARSTDLRTYLKNRFSVSTYDERYHVLDSLKIKTIFTTNIDDLLYKVYSGSKTNYLNDLDIRGPAYADRRAIDIITLHGSVIDDSRPFRFSNTDLAAAFGSDPDRWHYLTHSLQQRPTIFWGYSVSDAGTLEALNPATSGGRQHDDKWIIVHPHAADEGTLDYFRALDLQIVVADTFEMLEYLISLKSFISKPIQAGSQSSTKELFPQEYIPALGTVPVRPIIEFYLGAAPQWSDIFSGQLHRTAHFNRLRDAIHSGKHTIILGVPACGKTTLMMQVATDILTEGHKLMCSSLTPEKAHLFDAQLGGTPALIFIDNFTDSLEAFLLLSERSNIQLVGADRDFNFGSILHRIDPSRHGILDVTELSGSDIQQCLGRIPPSIHSPGARKVRADWGGHASLFELIEANISTPTLRQRFSSVLTQLGAQEPALRDLLVMMSYVYKSRVPVSTDMLLAYLRDHTTNYKVMMKMLERLGAMVAEYRGNLELMDAQDYFVPRSIIVAEAVIASASGPVLKEMLLRFHKNISPYRISRYDVFRKSAYDYNLISRAFPNADEGKEFFESLYYRDQSPYLLQHSALYLNHKRRYAEAFEMIDRAITASAGRIWSIRNSHAIILFKANIDHAKDPSARASLAQSMHILTECYRWDKRKPFHARIFAEQALQYWREVSQDEEAREYLQTAQKWLQEETRRAPWMRDIRKLLPEVTTALGQ